MEKIEKNVNLKRYNTYGVGGNADYFILAKEKQDLVDAYEFARDKDIPYTILGGGSNVLISDEDYNGLFVVNRANQIERDGGKIKVDSGTSLAKIVKFAAEEGLTGAEFLAGIPGTIGGAVSGNAGAWGREMKDILKSIEFLDDKGVRKIDRDDIGFSYRGSNLRKMDGIILSATLNLEEDSSENVTERVKETLQKRKGRHPQGKTCGSFFKNIKTKDLDSETLDRLEDYVVRGKIATGRLIEEAGCKGMKVGGVEVSDMHANFLVNRGDATADDIKKLAEQIQKKVHDKFGIELEPEVKYL